MKSHKESYDKIVQYCTRGKGYGNLYNRYDIELIERLVWEGDSITDYGWAVENNCLVNKMERV